MKTKSINAKLSQISVNGVLWLEVERGKHLPLMQKASLTTRRPKAMQHMRFTCALFTCVAAGSDEIRYTVRIERLA